MDQQPDPVHDPAPSLTPPSKKKKSKVRSAWISFGGRVVAQIVGAAASVALGLFVIQRSQQANREPAPAAPQRAETPRRPGEVAIAVLPLANFSADAQQEYFADGMTEALTAELAQIKGLHVISRTSVMQYKQSQKPVPQVARELGVDYIVEGSVNRADGRVRVTAQLINAKTDEHLWARSYDRTIRDVLALQAAVAGEIAGELRGVLGPSAPTQRRAVDPAVYDLYLRGRYAWALRTPEGFDNAVKYFTQATERDPEFALAYAGLADAFSLNPTASLVSRSVDNFARARAAAEKAIQLEPDLAEAHTSLAAVYFFGERNFEAATNEFKRALELNPNYPTAHQWYAIALSEQGQHAEALKHAEEAVKQDPLNGIMHQALGLVHYYARQYDEAEAVERSALKLNPQLPLARVVLAKSLVLQGNAREAAAVCDAAPAPRNTDVELMRGVAYARAGDRQTADAIFNDLAARRPRPTAVLAQWHAALGNNDAAFGIIGRSPAAIPPLMRIDPLYEQFRADPRFRSQ